MKLVGQYYPTIAFLALLVSPFLEARQETHILFGDVRVDESEAQGIVPSTFQLILRSLSGVVLGRETVPSGGRYRFSGVTIGEYTIGVEVDGREVARITVHINALHPSYIRRDISLAWKQLRPAASDPADPSKLLVYARSKENSDLFEKAENTAARGDLVEAINLFQALVDSDEQDFEAWTELGTLHFKREDLGSAESAYRRALEARSGYLLAWINLGKLFLARQDFEAAVEALTQVTDLDPQRAEAFYLLGDAYIKLRRGSLGAEALLKALELDPQGMADAHLLLGALYSAARYPDRAVLEYEAYLQKTPDSPQRREIEATIRRLRNQE